MILPLPKAKAKPQRYQTIAQIEKVVRILATTVPAFFWRENPISRNAKPACMNMTSTAATTTHIVLTPELSMGAVSARRGPASLSLCRRFGEAGCPTGKAAAGPLLDGASPAPAFIHVDNPPPARQE